MPQLDTVSHTLVTLVRSLIPAERRHRRVVARLQRFGGTRMVASPLTARSEFDLPRPEAA